MAQNLNNQNIAQQHVQQHAAGVEALALGNPVSHLVHFGSFGKPTLTCDAFGFSDR